MSSESLDCYILPTTPSPLLLPMECIAEVVSEPVIESYESAPAKWMSGHVAWRNQRLPVMDFSGLHAFADDSEKSEAPKDKGTRLLVVLNPIPGAARKAYSGLLCYGDVQQISVEPNLEFTDMPTNLDKRYIDGTIDIDGKAFIVPKLTAIAVAFTYF
ncbi:MAG: chemotaxis protein CheW [Gammaproteobacteria bacterium]|nr:chemotaxis protein CheW [Gammaproteobacteria bacterium]